MLFGGRDKLYEDIKCHKIYKVSIQIYTIISHSKHKKCKSIQPRKVQRDTVAVFLHHCNIVVIALVLPPQVYFTLLLSSATVSTSPVQPDCWGFGDLSVPKPDKTVC